MNRKINKRISLVWVFIFFINPNLVFAAGGAHGPSLGVESLLWPLVNFLIYLGILIYAYNRLVKPALYERSRQVVEKINKAAAVRLTAEEELKEVEERLRTIEGEKQEIREQLLVEGRNGVKEILKNAEQSAVSMRRDSERRMASDLGQAYNEIRKQIIKQAAERARRHLEAKLSPDDDYRLRQEALRAIL